MYTHNLCLVTFFVRFLFFNLFSKVYKLHKWNNILVVFNKYFIIMTFVFI